MLNWNLVAKLKLLTLNVEKCNLANLEFGCQITNFEISNLDFGYLAWLTLVVNFVGKNKFWLVGKEEKLKKVTYSAVAIDNEQWLAY